MLLGLFVVDEEVIAGKDVLALVAFVDPFGRDDVPRAQNASQKFCCSKKRKSDDHVGDQPKGLKRFDGICS